LSGGGGAGAPCLIVVGRVAGLFGVRGWLKIVSHTAPLENILHYRPWYLRAANAAADAPWLEQAVAESRSQDKGIVVRFEAHQDRDAAQSMLGAEIAVNRDQLPPLGQGEYYWADLVGLKVVTLAGVELGVIDHLLETGSNDVLVVKGERERLIPYIPGQVVREIDPAQAVVRVDWDPEF
jgi:16S rRNA processing protein RimM